MGSWGIRRREGRRRRRNLLRGGRFRMDGIEEASRLSVVAYFGSIIFDPISRPTFVVVMVDGYFLAPTECSVEICNYFSAFVLVIRAIHRAKAMSMS
jgi:hypothetical protein